MSESAFDNDIYLSAQYKIIEHRIAERPGEPAYIEFGGKPGDDHHASRVLPGYRPDVKIELLQSLMPRKPSGRDIDSISGFEQGVAARGVEFHKHYSIDSYPNPSVIYEGHQSFGANETIAKGDENLIIFSPGGGSGKFGVALSEMYAALRRGVSPTFIKFETFPVFNLPARHPLNLAFEAATVESMGYNLRMVGN